jgi:hypothetical protein
VNGTLSLSVVGDAASFNAAQIGIFVQVPIAALTEVCVHVAYRDEPTCNNNPAAH